MVMAGWKRMMRETNRIKRTYISKLYTPIQQRYMEVVDKLSYTISGKHAYLASLYVHKSGVPTPSDRRLDCLATIDIVYRARLLDCMR